MVGGSGQYPARETIPIATPTDTHTIPRISHLTHLAAVRVQGGDRLTGGDRGRRSCPLPTRQYIAGLLKRDAERPMVSEKERLARIADEGTRLARECAKLWRRLRDMPPGGTVEFEGGKSWDFDQVSPLLNSFRVLTKMTEPHPGCRAMWQCWSCDDGVKKGVCKHALIQHQTRGAVQAPGGVQASDRGEEAQARTPQEDRTCPLPPARG